MRGLSLLPRGGHGSLPAGRAPHTGGSSGRFDGEGHRLSTVGRNDCDARAAARCRRDNLASSVAGSAFSSPAADGCRAALARSLFNPSVTSNCSMSGPALDRRIDAALSLGEFEDCLLQDTECAYNRLLSKYDEWTPAQQDADKQASQRQRFLLLEARRDADHAAAHQPVLPPPPSAASPAHALWVEVRKVKSAHARADEPELKSLFKYHGEVEDICGGRVSSARHHDTHLMCSVRPDLCCHKHTNKCHQLLRPGFYVDNARGDTFFQEHFVSHAAAEASKNFDAFRTARIPLAQMVSLVQGSASGGDVVLVDAKRFLAYAASPAAGTPTPARAHRPAKAEVDVGPPDFLGGSRVVEIDQPTPDKEVALNAATNLITAL